MDVLDFLEQIMLHPADKGQNCTTKSIKYELRNIRHPGNRVPFCSSPFQFGTLIVHTFHVAFERFQRKRRSEMEENGKKGNLTELQEPCRVMS